MLNHKQELTILTVLFILMLFITYFVSKCDRINNLEQKYIEKQFVSDKKKFEQQEKMYLDSLKRLSKQIKVKEVIKEKTVVKYITKKQEIIKYRDSLIYGKDTGTLITIYDSTLTLCDSLNLVNHDIIQTQQNKMNTLDSIYANEQLKNKLFADNIKQLNKDLKKQKRVGSRNTIIGTSLGFLGGVGTGFLIGKIK